jgi:aminopeptidase YwaD
MLPIHPFLSAVLLFISLFSFGQKKNKKISKADIGLITNLQSHISYLADDKLEGRRAGTNGEKLAREYISNQFSTIGLTGKGTDGFFQPFEIYEGKQINPGTLLIINGDELKAGKDFFPFVFSPNISLEALPSVALQEMDMPWFFNLKETLEENANNPHFDLLDFIKTKAKKAKEKTATALFIYNTTAIADKLEFNGKDKSAMLPIPVIYISKAAAQKFFKNESVTTDLKLKIDIGDKKRTGNNVIGFIDNGASNTVIIGAHFDHLGFGEDGNSMIRNMENPGIHNGADDNASGTAAMIELARMFKMPAGKNNSFKNSNYLFIAFSGEELGLYGSKYFTEKPTIDLKTVNYMINMDMVGRLNDSTKILTVGGYGTSPAWSDYYNKMKKIEMGRVSMPRLNIKYDSSGTGPSDHTSFYRKDIPVLFYFTGLHSDYHKPSDDADKINYTGELLIIQHIYSLIETFNNQPRIAFTKTRETQTTTSARFSVTMGIMPDYTFSGSGVRADGVSDGRPAQKAGLKTGDVIVQLGDYPVSSVENYMQVLGKFKKGDKTKVRYKRANETKEAEVEF